MAFKDGMGAIAKVLKVIAVVAAAISLFAGISDHNFAIGASIAVILFIMFWTPAWVIKKFIQ